MTQAAHTPGPWWVVAPKKIDGKHYACGDAFKIGAQDVAVARDRDGWPIGSVPAHSPEADANARLIAAAPELLAALQSLIADVLEYERINNLSPSPSKQDCWQSVTLARAAIAKATGAQP